MEFYKKYLSGFVPSFETSKNEMINLIDNSNMLYKPSYVVLPWKYFKDFIDKKER